MKVKVTRETELCDFPDCGREYLYEGRCMFCFKCFCKDHKHLLTKFPYEWSNMATFDVCRDCQENPEYLDDVTKLMLAKSFREQADIDWRDAQRKFASLGVNSLHDRQTARYQMKERG